MRGRAVVHKLVSDSDFVYRYFHMQIQSLLETAPPFILNFFFLVNNQAECFFPADLIGTVITTVYLSQNAFVFLPIHNITL